MYSFYPGAAYSSRRQQRPVFTSYAPSIQTPLFYPVTQSDFSLDDSFDEEELLLRAALERKQRQRLALQYRQQQQPQFERQLLIEQQRRIEQERYDALLKKERARQLAIAQTLAQYEAEQEAAIRYRRAQLIQEKHRRQQSSVLEAIILQGIRQAQQEQEASHIHDHIHAQVRAKSQAISEAKRQATALAIAASDDSDEDNDKDLNPLEALLGALFFQNQKRPQPQEENYPCKRRHQQQPPQQQQAQEQEKVDKRPAEQEAKAKQEQQQQEKQKQASDPLEEIYATLPAVLAFVEAVFRGENETSSQGCSRKSDASGSSDGRSNGHCNRDTAAATTAKSASAIPSSSESSPELKAADILRQRQRQQEERTQDLQQKHSELNLIESALDSFAHDLTEALEGTTSEENKKMVLSAEDSVSKAMFRIDSVQSDGDLSVRQRRKELIKKSQDMLDLVDKFKSLESNTGKKVDRNTDLEASASDESSEKDSEAVGQEVEVEPADVVDSLPEAHFFAQDQDKGDTDEDVEPYNVSVTTSSPTVTVQDDSEHLPSEPTSVEVEAADVEQVVTETVNDDEREEEVASEEPKSTEVAESAHDDYEIVSEF
ncbi:hypothetical protein BGX21_007513 [Mortierella sp. AD011]|nr:hypothetical protein BGX20_003158 [Mortierella sp. AD010]KAF9398641.1 hypothetical protein BGX21_007513 [Mortierella sp. AD011]